MQLHPLPHHSPVHDLLGRAAQAMVEQMQRDHALLRARIQRLGGQAGLARLEAALAAVRANAPATPPSPPRLSPRGTPPRTPTAAPASSQSSQQRDPNEALAWELLYDFAWRMPTTELDAVWDDATGATGNLCSSLMEASSGPRCSCRRAPDSCRHEI